MMTSAQILSRDAVDLKVFREEIMTASEPMVLKGLVKDWPAVQAGVESARALGDYLRGLDLGKPVNVLEGPPSIQGHFFYREDMRGFNFERRPAAIGATIERLLAQYDDPNPQALYIESTPTAEHMPEFAAANPHPLLPPTIAPRIWIGNTLVVQAHFDLSSNIACVVGGRRRFTLFPPDQVANLYVGPFEFNVSGLPISMVNLKAPDLGRFPRFAQAQRHSRSAELEPGDAIYIPYGWWHHVESLTPFNVLVNYWWNEARPAGSPFDCMLHAMLTLRDLPDEQRAAWRELFEHYVFTAADEALAHLPREQRGMLGPPSAERTQAIRAILARAFSRP
ncbi:MAG TPA: cupin-like domain-containing protein [Steroidobacteraceae bacterium]|nr:cupin-like domain-containing protein [Steroidobacteraceae bacterium]